MFSHTRFPKTALTRLLYLFLSILLAFQLTNKILAQEYPPINQADSLALIQIYHSMGGENWTNSENWLEGKVHTWYGVGVATYNTDGDRVTGIYLSENNLLGEFPVINSGLEELEILDLHGNNLLGTFPQVQHLSSLEYISLQDNLYGGEIPEFINELTELKSLNLQSNLFETAHPDLFNSTSLTNLIALDLRDNKLGIQSDTGYFEFFQSICNLSSLVLVDMSNNYLDCPIPTEIGNLNNLYRLNLRNCGLTDTIPSSIGDLIELNRLDLVSNYLTGEVPNSFSNLLNLKDLYLMYNDLTGLPEVFLLSLPDDVRVYNNHFTYDDIVPNLGIAPQFEYSPQKPFDKEKTFYFKREKGVTLESEDAGEGADYQWLKNGTIIPGATSKHYHIGSATLEDSADIYQVVATHTAVPDLTLYSGIKNINTRNSLYSGLWRDGDEVVIITGIVGDVLVSIQGGPWETAHIGQSLTWGDEINTGIDSQVRIMLPDQSHVTLNELVLLRIGSLFRERDTLKTRLLLKIGELEAQVRPKETVFSDFSVRTPIATASVRGTYFGIAHDPTNGTTLSVTNGDVQISNVGYSGFNKPVSNFIQSDSLMISDWQQITVTDEGFGSVENITLTQIEITVDYTEFFTGEDMWFTCIGTDTRGFRMRVKPDWTTNAGSIDSTGYFIAGNETGQFTINAHEPTFNLNTTIDITIIDAPVSVEDDQNLPVKFELRQNYPNPFNPTTTIEYSLPVRCYVSINLYDVLGNKVTSLLSKLESSGEHKINLNGEKLSSGVYFYRINAIPVENHSGKIFSQTKKVVLIK